MRYLGNKESILTEIEAVLSKNNLIDKRLTFFDAFCGSGSVSNYFKKHYDLIINDNLKWSVIYTRGRICASQCSFKKLGFDPFVFFNTNQETERGFIYKTYAPTETSRMYFTPENASRIDYFRKTIQEWWQKERISQDEYCYLLACLIESVSDVSNTAGVYGAFLKKWDSRATKKIIFSKVDSLMCTPKSLKMYNGKIEEIINEVDCDILYMDPPYTQNQYGTQYHLLETLILDDSPEVSKITGSRKTAQMRSDWSKEYKSNILFDSVLAKTKAKYVILSYNNDGFMSKDFIEAVMKRYGKPETYSCKKIAYKKYQNWKSNNQDEHYEYLFFVEMKEKNKIVYESPLNYIGSKAKIVTDIKSFIPADVDVFFDLFGGGFNVGVNANADKITYNDINHFVKEIVEALAKYEVYDFLLYSKKIIKQYGLKAADAEAYNNARAFYNSLPTEKKDPRFLFTLIMYGYQQQIRFNGKHEFNNPVGMRWLNDKVLEKMISFSRYCKEKQCIFMSENYLELEDKISANDFVYLDPPYQLTTGAYNDGKRGFDGWNAELENTLFEFAYRLNKKNIPFMLSYVAEHKGVVNKNLLNWVKENKYHIIELGDILGISGSRRKEVLVVNYEISK
ncbi:MAG: DNA adenine methylase [Eubacteriales bacterium]|nr:DNA adenine methylase [Eubacteriales bacterium]